MSETNTIIRQTPLDVARAMRHRRGFAYLDSSLAGVDSLSILAWEPDFILQGNDWTQLEAELANRFRISAKMGYPDGAAIGHIRYDGEFFFAFHDTLHIYDHGRSIWNQEPDTIDPIADDAVYPPCDFKPLVKKEKFLSMVESAKEYIATGDIYQVCLSHPFVATRPADPWAFYERLRHCSPVPFGAFLDEGNLKIASASPECFLKMSGRKISTRPIKGTRPRKIDAHSDRLSSQELLNSSKETAELIMITDLERNDLGKVCRFGSVSVPDLLQLEAYEQVFHLVSTVTGELRPEISHVQALKSCFPGGSISGAPKKRAMEIIKELEPYPRGAYTGAIGYFGYNGESQFSMTIRTAFFENNSAHFHVGAGIVADSNPEQEWEETLTKASGLLLAANQKSFFTESGNLSL